MALGAEVLPSLQFTLKAQVLFSFFAEFALGTLSGELVRRVGGLKIVDRGEEVGNLVA